MNIKYFKILFPALLIITACSVYPQEEYQKWGKADYSYQIPVTNSERDYGFHSDNAGDIILKSAADAYWIFISDVDGDNCSFSPTCSNFFLQSVKQTNLFQGTIMFFDRFTRDMDIFKIYNQYPRVADGHFYDPPSLYTLDETKIKYLPPFEVINK